MAVCAAGAMESSKKTSLLERKHIHISQPFETCSIATTLTSPLRQRPIYPIFSAKGSLEHATKTPAETPKTAEFHCAHGAGRASPHPPIPTQTEPRSSEDNLYKASRALSACRDGGRSKQWRAELSNTGNKLDTPSWEWAKIQATKQTASRFSFVRGTFWAMLDPHPVFMGLIELTNLAPSIGELIWVEFFPF